MLPNSRKAILGCGDLYVMQIRRSVIPCPHIVLTGPYHLYRLATLAGNVNSFNNPVGIERAPPAKTSSKEGCNYFYILGVDIKNCRNVIPICRWKLRASPNMALIGHKFYGTVQGFHGRVSEIGQKIFGLEGFCGLCECSFYITS